MYDASDPRAALAAAPAAAPKVATRIRRRRLRQVLRDRAAGKRTPPAAPGMPAARTTSWPTARPMPGAVLRAEQQVDEYALILPDAATRVEISAKGETKTVDGYSIASFRPATARSRMLDDGRIVRLITSRSSDLTAKCSNAASYAKPHPNIPPFEPWPDAAGGLSHPHLQPRRQAGARPFRPHLPLHDLHGQLSSSRATARATSPSCRRTSTTISSNARSRSTAPSSTTSAGRGRPTSTHWRDDDHELCGSPSIAVIPPPAIHTSRAIGPGSTSWSTSSARRAWISRPSPAGCSTPTNIRCPRKPRTSPPPDT